jgi:hypothetical protein
MIDVENQSCLPAEKRCLQQQLSADTQQDAVYGIIVTSNSIMGRLYLLKSTTNHYSLLLSHIERTKITRRRNEVLKKKGGKGIFHSSLLPHASFDESVRSSTLPKT